MNLAFIRNVSVIILFMIYSVSVSAQWDKKPAAEWSSDDAGKILNDSPWVKKYSITHWSKPATLKSRGNNDQEYDPRNYEPRTEKIPDGQTTFYIRLLSAKPLREALKRSKLMQQENSKLRPKLEALVNSGPSEYIIVGVGHETQYTGAYKYEPRLMPSGLYPELIANTFLEVKGGKRLPLYAYISGGAHDFRIGGLFIFNRFVEGKPAITPDNNEVRFHTKFSILTLQYTRRNLELDVSYKVKNMLYEGNLEF